MPWVPLEKQSKKQQKAWYARRRGSWEGVVPVTKVMADPKKYDRSRARREVRRIERAEMEKVY